MMEKDNMEFFHNLSLPNINSLHSKMLFLLLLSQMPTHAWKVGSRSRWDPQWSGAVDADPEIELLYFWDMNYKS